MANLIDKAANLINNVLNGGTSTGIQPAVYKEDRNHPVFPMDLMKQSSIVNDDMSVIDNDWCVNRFMAASNELGDIDRANRFWSNSRWKTFDTSPGGNIAMNARPQYTRYADVRNGTRAKQVSNPVTLSSLSGNFGMGRYYSEAIDDNATTIFMEFGVPKFNGILDFFTRAHDPVDIYVAKHGVMPNDVAFKTGQVAGAVLVFYFFPLMTLAILAAKWLGAALTANSGNSFNFYYMEKTMHTYWGVVNTLVTNFCAESGLINVLAKDGDAQAADKIGREHHIDSASYKELQKMFPTIFKNSGYIDVYALATRAQRRAHIQRRAEYKAYVQAKDSGKDTTTDMLGYNAGNNKKREFQSPGSSVLDMLDYHFSVGGLATAVGDLLSAKKDEGETFDAVCVRCKNLDKIKKEEGGGQTTSNDPKPEEAAKPEKELSTLQLETGGKYKINDQTQVDALKEQAGKDEKTRQAYGTNGVEGEGSSFDGTLRDGGMFAVFNVDYQGSVSESFSNSTGEIALKGMQKGIAKAVHDVRFSTADLSLSSVIAPVENSIKSLLSGVTSSVTFGLSNVISTIFGGFVDMPLKWEDSSANFPQISYKMRLVSPYGNPISQLLNIYIPLFMLMAGALPLSVGKRSYTSPFLCSIFNKGVQRVDMGMITSLTLERGTSNLGYSKSKRPLAIDVTFTVTDFSTLTATPTPKTVFGGDIFNPILEDDTTMGKYMSVLASRSILTQKYLGQKFRIFASKMFNRNAKFISGSYWGMFSGELIGKYTPVGILTQDGMHNDIVQGT